MSPTLGTGTDISVDQLVDKKNISILIKNLKKDTKCVAVKTILIVTWNDKYCWKNNKIQTFNFSYLFKII